MQMRPIPGLAWISVNAALVLLADALFAATPAWGQAPSKVALVVGNAAYQHAAPLANPKNDAEDMATALEDLGFAVERAMNLDYRAFTEHVVRFSKRTNGTEAALFYYAGHGLQVGGVNYLVPVDVALDNEMQVRFQTVDLNAVLQRMKSSANLVFLDACRDNPFVRSVARSMGTRSSAVGRGLAPVEDGAYGGAFIAFATAAGEVASDGEGRNSPFTAALKQHIGSPGLEINQVLNRVRRELAGIEQEPWSTSSLVEDFFFSTGPPAVSLMPSTTRPADPRFDPAEELWNQIKTSNNAGQFERFMQAFPNSPLAHAARARLDELRGQPFTVAVAPSGARVRILNIEPPYRAGMKLPAGEYRVEASARGYRSKIETVWHPSSGPTVHRVELEKLLEVGARFRDCPGCPEMVVVPSGSFLMGAPSHEEDRLDGEGPVHQVTIGAPFAVGVYEVTVVEFGRFVKETSYRSDSSCFTHEAGEGKSRTGRSWRDPGFRQGESHPAVCVSWDDARSYAAWLSRETGESYRLPSESEWEYVARAGTRAAWHWGDSESGQCSYANGADISAGLGWGVACNDGHARTAPIGSYKANAWGLHDVLGNVWEWTGDCLNESYAGASSDGRAWATGDCTKRICRGGAWYDDPPYLRSAYRNWNSAGNNVDTNGFRVARTLAP